MTLIDKEEALTAIANEIRKLHTEDAIVVGEKIEEIGLRTAFDIIKHLPTVESRPKGRWIEAIDTGVKMLECSACESRIKKRNYADSVGTEGYNFCPYCGADMRGNQDVKR